MEERTRGGGKTMRRQTEKESREEVKNMGKGLEGNIERKGGEEKTRVMTDGRESRKRKEKPD